MGRFREKNDPPQPVNQQIYRVNDPRWPCSGDRSRQDIARIKRIMKKYKPWGAVGLRA